MKPLRFELYRIFHSFFLLAIAIAIGVYSSGYFLSISQKKHEAYEKSFQVVYPNWGKPPSGSGSPDLSGNSRQISSGSFFFNRKTLYAYLESVVPVWIVFFVIYFAAKKLVQKRCSH